MAGGVILTTILSNNYFSEILFLVFTHSHNILPWIYYGYTFIFGSIMAKIEGGQNGQNAKSIVKDFRMADD